ncbi:MAG: IPT/TIG domain-containing protein [Alphaproteobacteria bacterium]|nr:IPT/TIG domain-containing protein [Alphaproteobacteria bacterium]
MLSALLLIACTAAPPTVDAVSPAEGQPGDAVKILGDQLVEGTTATLGGQPVDGLTVRGLTLMEGKVPAGLAPGPVELVVTAPDGQSARKAAAFEVKGAPKEEVPCGGDYTAYSAVATDQQVIKLDRFYKKPKESREVIELHFRDIEAIEYQARVMDDGAWCSAILIRMKDGGRYLFDDDHDVDLKDRAQEIAQGIGRGIDVLAEEPRPEPEAE